MALGTFIFEKILCRWGGLAEIVTDNGKPFVEALYYLATRYNINHIRISPTTRRPMDQSNNDTAMSEKPS